MTVRAKRISHSRPDRKSRSQIRTTGASQSAAGSYAERAMIPEGFEASDEDIPF